MLRNAFYISLARPGGVSSDFYVPIPQTVILLSGRMLLQGLEELGESKNKNPLGSVIQSTYYEQ